MFQNKILKAGIIFLLIKYGLVDALAPGEIAPGDGWYYSGDGGFDNLCPISQCQNNCTIGYYHAGCSGNSSGRCISCDNKPVNSYYNTKGNFISDCAWTCDSGFIQSGSICIENSKCTKSIPLNSAYSNAAYPDCEHKCNAGFFNPQTSINPVSCTTCQAGTYSSRGDTTCTLCPGGTFSNYVGSPSIVNCQACSAGTYSTFTGAQQPTVCLNCQVGTFSTAIGAAAESSCHACPEGSFSTSIGANNAAVCALCATGKYASVTGRSVCTSCDAGSFASGTGTARCTQCPANTYAPEIGMISCTRCEYCSTPGIFRTGCGPVSAGYCTVCFNPAVQ